MSPAWDEESQGNIRISDSNQNNNRTSVGRARETRRVARSRSEGRLDTASIRISGMLLKSVLRCDK